MFLLGEVCISNARGLHSAPSGEPRMWGLDLGPAGGHGRGIGAESQRRRNAELATWHQQASLVTASLLQRDGERQGGCSQWVPQQTDLQNNTYPNSYTRDDFGTNHLVQLNLYIN